MAFFGLFKSKEERLVDDVNKLIFPGGESDVTRDCERVNSITKGKIAPDKLRGFVAACKTLIYVSKRCDAERFVPSFMQHAEGRITESEAYDMYVYFEGEARFYDITRQFGQGTSFGNNTPWTYAAGTRTDEIPGGYGEYGLTVTNPIPTVSVRCSDHYLGMLRYGGHPVQANRVGSMKSDVTPGPVDLYTLSCGGREIGNIFISSYHKKNSRRAPRGFTPLPLT